MQAAKHSTSDSISPKLAEVLEQHTVLCTLSTQQRQVHIDGDGVNINDAENT